MIEKIAILILFHEHAFHLLGHEIAEFFARATSGPPPVSILNDCHLQPQPAPAPPQSVATTPHDVVLDLGLSAVVTPKKVKFLEFKRIFLIENTIFACIFQS